MCALAQRSGAEQSGVQYLPRFYDSVGRPVVCGAGVQRRQQCLGLGYLLVARAVALVDEEHVGVLGLGDQQVRQGADLAVGLCLTRPLATDVLRRDDVVVGECRPEVAGVDDGGKRVQPIRCRRGTRGEQACHRCRRRDSRGLNHELVELPRAG